MFRRIFMLRKNIIMSRIVSPSYTLGASLMKNSARLHSLAMEGYSPNLALNVSRLYSKSVIKSGTSSDASNEGITVTDINIFDMAKGDVEFTRNFVTSLPSIDSATSVSLANSPTSTDPESTVDTNVADGTESNLDSSPQDGCSSILDREGMPIVPIEIDGWKNANEEDDDGPTVLGDTKHVEIGNDDEYKAEKQLQVPETREGCFEYKGIKVKLPETANKDIGTYRFRRDPEDLATVADDMRVVKYDKKE